MEIDGRAAPPLTRPPGERALPLVALAVLLTGLLLGQADRPVQAPDELREAAISLEMARTGDLVTPRLNGRPFLEKPPLFHALAAGFFTAAGTTSPLAVRAPAILCALATAAATFVLARRIAGERIAVISVALLATSGGFFSASHSAVTDSAIPPALTLAWHFLERFRTCSARVRPSLALGAALGVTFLAKGLVGPAIFVAGAVPYLLWQGDLLRLVASARLPFVLLGALAPIALWLGLLHAREGAEAVRIVLIDNNLQRATSGVSDHARPWHYYAPNGVPYFLPWLPLAALAAVALTPWRPRALQGLLDSLAPPRAPAGPMEGSASLAEARGLDLRLPAAWLLPGLTLLSIVKAKRPIYLLPCVPPAAILAAASLDALAFRDALSFRGRRVLLAVAAVLSLMVGVVGTLDLHTNPGSLAGGALALPAAVIPLAALAFALHEEATGGGGAVLGWRRAATLGALTLPLAAGMVLGLRVQSAAKDGERSFEDLGAHLRAEAAAARQVALVLPSEATTGAACFYLERTVPEAHSMTALVALRERAPAAGLALLVTGENPWVEQALGPGRVVWRATRNRRPTRLVVYER